MNNFDPTLLSFLQEHHISFDYYEHRPIFTVEEGEDMKHMIPGIHTKNLFLMDKRGQYYLVCVESSKRLPINQFRKLIGAKDMTFGTAEEMKEILGLTPGSVSLFGLVQAVSDRLQATEDGDLKPTAGSLQPKLYIDRELWGAEKVGRHPNRNDATIMIDHENLEKFLSIIKKPASLIEIQDSGVRLVGV